MKRVVQTLTANVDEFVLFSAVVDLEALHMVWQVGLSPTGPLPLLLQLQYEEGNTYAMMPEGFPATESDETKVSYQGT
jgi:hypothetical protein